MPEYRIDLDVPEEAPPPPRGLRRRGFLFGGAAVAVLAAGAGLTRLTGPDEPPGPIELREEWSHRLPTTLGTVVSAQVRDTTVLVAAQNGLLAVDRGTGTALWSRALGPEILGALAGGLTRDNVWFYVRLAGSTLVIPRYTDGVHSAFEAIDLRSGATRFTLPVVSGPDGEPPAQSRLTENTLLVQGFADEIAAYALDDGRRLWRRPLVEAIAVLPSDVSLNHQHTGIANTGPGHIEPVGGVYLEVRIPDEDRLIDVVRIDDGAVIASWPNEWNGLGWLEIVAGAVLLVDPAERLLQGLDAATGETVWNREWLRGSFESPGPHWSLTDGLLIDAPPGTGGYQLIDPATGEGPEPLDLGGRKVVFTGRDLAVGIDSEPAELTAFGAASWTAALRPEGWTAAGFRPEGVLTGGDRLVIGGELGFGGETQRHLWVVELSTGRVGRLPDGLLAGFEDGALLSVTGGDERTVRLHELGG